MSAPRPTPTPRVATILRAPSAWPTALRLSVCAGLVATGVIIVALNAPVVASTTGTRFILAVALALALLLFLPVLLMETVVARGLLALTLSLQVASVLTIGGLVHTAATTRAAGDALLRTLPASADVRATDASGRELRGALTRSELYCISRGWNDVRIVAGARGSELLPATQQESSTLTSVRLDPALSAALRALPDNAAACTDVPSLSRATGLDAAPHARPRPADLTAGVHP